MKVYSCCLFFIVASIVGCAHKVSKTYSLASGGGKSVIYGKMQYTTNEGQVASILLKHEASNRTIRIFSNSKTSIQEFVKELEPGNWHIVGYSVTYLPKPAPFVHAPAKTGNSQIDGFQTKLHEQEKWQSEESHQRKELLKSSQDKKSKKDEKWVFEIPAGKLVYVGNWDISLEGILQITDEKEMDDLIISEEFKNLNAGEAVVAIPKQEK